MCGTRFARALLLGVAVQGRARSSANNFARAQCKVQLLQGSVAGAWQRRELEIYTGTCTAHAGVGGATAIYKFHNVNIYGGGQLVFADEGNIDFWAESILIENNGSLTAGNADEPYGAKGTLTIHLYGKDLGTGTGKGDGGAGITCRSDSKNQCGVPDKLWTSNCPGNDCMGPMLVNPPSCVRAKNVEGYKQNLSRQRG